MTAVLVHGVPETSALWGPITPHLTGQEVVTLGLPGFGTPLPDEEFMSGMVAMSVEDRAAMLGGPA
jgi:pimeloyl-ACP methyl ester carboxylesterase